MPPSPEGHARERRAEGPLVIIAPAVRAVPELVRDWGLPGDVVRLVEARPRREERHEVVLVAHDVRDLRAAATAIGPVGTASRVVVHLQRPPASLPRGIWQPDWPPLEEVAAKLGTPTSVRLHFSGAVQVRGVIVHLARAFTPSMSPTIQWPALGARRDEPHHWPVNDPTATVAVPERLYDGDVDLPPDVITVTDPQGADRVAAQPNAVLGRAPLVRRSDPDVAWETLIGSSDPGAVVARLDPLSLGAVDDKLFNPIEFERSSTGHALPLLSQPDGSLVAAHDGRDPVWVADRHGRVSDADLRELRRLPGIDLGWTGCLGPQAYCRAVATLACTGVPLVAAQLPDWARRLLAPDLVGALTAPADLGDELAREEHSVRIRRAGLRNHAAAPWRRAMAGATGAQAAEEPRVSVLLATRRPDMLAFALRQVARQRNVDFELIIAAHGFEPSPGQLREFTDRSTAPLTVVPVDTATPFGAVLNKAADRSSGDLLLKVDDDDWYGPDFVSDLLLARSYSGAGLVGAFPEITYLEPLEITIRRAGPTESYNMHVAGGTLLVSREVFRAIGAFRATRKYVDASLIRSVHHSGAGVYRTHGLGYVLRRQDSGHTWDPGLGYFLARDRVAQQWRGFRPSAVLESDPADSPASRADRGTMTT
jgi:hypothetical protein